MTMNTLPLLYGDCSRWQKKRNRGALIQMLIRITLEFFEKYKCPGIAFFFFPLQSSSCVSNEQPCLKTTRLCDDLLLFSSLFRFFYFIVSAPISFSSCSPISPSLSLFMFFLKPLTSTVEKLLYTYIKTVCIMYMF